MIKHTVYKTTNLINGKIYIGVHKQTCEKDWYLGSGKTLHNAIKKYGRGCFAKETLFEFASSEEAYAKEAELVNKDFVERFDTYNIVLGGGGSNGAKRSEAHKEAIRKSKLGIPRSEETKLKVSSTRKLRKIPAPNKGIPMSKEQKLLASLSRKGIKTGIAMNQKTKDALRAANVGRSPTEETKSKWQKCLIVDGVKYTSMSDAAVKYSISNSSVTHRVKSALDKWKDWNYA